MSFLSFLRKISNKEKEIFISEERFFSLLERVSAFDVVREWAENGGAYYPLLECRRLTDIEDVRKSEDILNRLEFIDRRFREFISIMSEYNRNDKSKTGGRGNCLNIHRKKYTRSGERETICH
ncbi:TPA: hypothetical protein ACUA6Z_004714 [Escherichia coli]|uniref:hypothetical protein n=1 Tax=Escherichia coli TaxID=562 RepID=UPI0023EB86AC|nr:hypothetical protein [Escherichia coli]